MKKNRQYTRELTSTQIKELQAEFKSYGGAKKRGFLSTNHRKVLLHQSKVGKRTSTINDSDFYYVIREKAKTGFVDYSLIVETLEDSQLEEIFSINKATPERSFSILTVLNRLFELNTRKIPVVDAKQKKVGTMNEPIPIDDLWKALLAEAVLKTCIEFFKSHRYISTNIHNRFLDELEEMINVEISRASQLDIRARVKGIV